MAYDSEQIYSYFRFISDRTELGILITNTGYTGVTLRPGMVNRLADLENIIAVKNSPPMPHTLETLSLVGDRILVSHLDERNFFPLMAEHGCQFYMSSASPYLLQKPGFTPIKDYTALFLAHRIEEATALARSLDPARQVFDKWLRDPWSTRRVMPIAYLKAWCDLMGGMVGDPVRPPLLQITGAERAELQEGLAKIGLLESAALK